VKYLISAESKLRESMLDTLHKAVIEIVSPTFVNRRQLSPERVFIPKVGRSVEEKPPAEKHREQEKKEETDKEAS
jgi:hypothetical protein